MSMEQQAVIATLDRLEQAGAYRPIVVNGQGRSAATVRRFLVDATPAEIRPVVTQLQELEQQHLARSQRDAAHEALRAEAEAALYGARLGPNDPEVVEARQRQEDAAAAARASDSVEGRLGRIEELLARLVGGR